MKKSHIIQFVYPQSKFRFMKGMLNIERIFSKQIYYSFSDGYITFLKITIRKLNKNSYLFRKQLLIPMHFPTRKEVLFFRYGNTDLLTVVIIY